ncbi:MAG: uroporphyrinogen decarboxylase family protein [Candidatus Latescibacterota bacterium]|jgi:uroporphyrinogen decarboxylase
MTTRRQRLLDAFHYTGPDRIPVVYHPSTAGLHVHGQKLLDLFNQYPPDNQISFTALPAPPPEALDAQGRYHEVRRDEWGTEREFLIFGVAGYPRSYPFPDWAAAADYRFPPVPTVGSAAFAARQEEVRRQRQEYLVVDGGLSLFERLHALRPMEDVLIGLAEDDPHLLAFLDRLTQHWHAVLDLVLALEVDVVTFGDDWGGQDAPLVSPALFRRVFKPRYQELMQRIRQAGRKVFLHCCGYVGPLLEDFFELGIAGYWPQITRYDLDELSARCREHRVAVYLHPDRQYLVPRGTPAEIEAIIREYAERYHRLGGGGIFYLEMENDAPWENVRALIEAVHRYR